MNIMVWCCVVANIFSISFLMAFGSCDYFAVDFEIFLSFVQAEIIYGSV